MDSLGCFLICVLKFLVAVVYMNFVSIMCPSTFLSVILYAGEAFYYIFLNLVFSILFFKISIFMLNFSSVFQFLHTASFLVDPKHISLSHSFVCLNPL